MIAAFVDDRDGALCLEFANTWGNRDDVSTDRLQGFEDLLSWARDQRMTTAEESEELRAYAAAHPAEAEAALRRARTLRDAVFRTFSAVAAGEAPAANDLSVINDELVLTLPQLRLVTAHPGCCWQWAATAESLDGVLRPVVCSAAQMLTAEGVDRVRECASEDCSWLFVDRSRNRRRRWCDMASCGNRAKARRHYARHHHNGAG